MLANFVSAYEGTPHRMKFGKWLCATNGSASTSDYRDMRLQNLVPDRGSSIKLYSRIGASFPESRVETSDKSAE